ncbi:MAG: PVC-type heme-binding CxxCH protein [Gemmataceae bacterium]
MGIVSVVALALLSRLVPAAPDSDAPRQLELNKGDRIVLIGNTLAEREQYFGHFETLLHSRFPELELVVRNLGWSADELTLRPRSLNFDHHGHTLKDHQPDVILAFFGFNESFAGPAGLSKFEADLAKFITDTTTTKYNGKAAPRLVLVSPIAQENTGRPGVTDGSANNKNIQLYTDAMNRIAAKQGVLFVDLFTPTRQLMSQGARQWTFNGIHLTDYGYSRLAPILDEALFGPRPAVASKIDLDKLRREVNEKNLQFFYDHRAVNGYYIYGGRKAPFGIVNFPEEFQKLRKMIANRDRRIWSVAQGQLVPDQIDDSNTGELSPIVTNFKGTITITPPEEAAKKFTLPEGFEINLFASEVDFPELQNPVQFAFDNKGRLFVCTMQSYPMYFPGKPVDDKVLILEDTTGDGKADSCQVFADKLHIPTGIELGDGGAYVAQQPNLVFLKDTTGDGKADSKEIILHGFDTADSHHAISTFQWGPGGALYFQEGTFHHTQVETPYGPRRLKNAGVFRYEPRTEKFDIFVSYPFANPWGHVFDRWGQNFVADASGGANYYGTAFSGQVDYPNKHPRMQEFLTKQWRPTCGCELVSSRHFPDEMQGNYLLNNTIGFLGVLQYKMKDKDSGFAADPVEPLLRSSDPNFRPVDLVFGPDGALYICDWFNPLIGHMQHSLRDPNRDKSHGRIWRITYKHKPLLKPADIAGQPVPALLELLKEYEDRTRYRARLELRLHETKTVMAELDKWIAGLDKKDKEYPHHLLEALWVCQHHDVVNTALLKQLLTAPDYRARAAATRVLCYWRDRVAQPLELLRTQVNDEHPRVRLEAVRALSFFDVPEAQDVALESLAHPQDYYLEYTLKETLNTLDRRLTAKK